MMKHAFDAQNLSRQAVRFLTLLFLVYVHVIVSIGTVIQKQSNLDMAYYMFICIFLVLIIMDDTINKNLVILIHQLKDLLVCFLMDKPCLASDDITAN